MDLLYCLAVTFLFLHITDGQYEVTDKKYQWNESSIVCRVATPTLILKDEVLVANTSSIIKDDVWVTYVRKQIAFEYVGCTKKINDLTQFGLKKNDPGLCYFKCNYSSIVGLYKKKCFCLSMENLRDTIRTSPYCNSTCPGQTDAACGGKDNDTKYVSLYRPAEMVQTHKGTGNCLSYQRAKQTLWQSCEIALTVACLNVSIVMLRNSDSNSSWIESSVKCFTNGEKPIISTSARIGNSNDTSLKWTGIIRSDVIYTNDSTSTVRLYERGFLAVKNETYCLKFENQTRRKKLLCDHGSILTSSPPTELTRSSTNTIKALSPTAEPVESSPSSTESEDKKDIYIIIFGSTLGAVLCINIVTGIIVFLRKRNAQTSQSKSGDEMPQLVIHNESAHNESAPNDIRHDLSDISPEYVDIDLVTLSHNEDHNGAPGIFSHAEDNSGLKRENNEEDDDTYDTTKPGNPKTGPDECNPYNILIPEESSEYDHIGVGNQHSRNVGTKLPYSKNIYSTTSPENAHDCLENDIPESNNINNTTEIEDKAM